jgi:hypothetical protein
MAGDSGRGECGGDITPEGGLLSFCIVNPGADADGRRRRGRVDSRVLSRSFVDAVRAGDVCVALAFGGGNGESPIDRLGGLFLVGEVAFGSMMTVRLSASNYICKIGSWIIKSIDGKIDVTPGRQPPRREGYR